jgi:hypothetical protein
MVDVLLWLMIGLGALAAVALIPVCLIPTRPAGRAAIEADLANPWNVHMEVRVAERLFLREETLHLQAPGETATITVRLKRHMRGKVVRLPNAVRQGKGHLFLRFHLIEETARAEAPQGRPIQDDELEVLFRSRPAIDEEELDRLRQQLRVKVMYDEAKVERLIEHEREREPGAGPAAWLRAALERWERDNR